jgi:hypothetical protein
MEDLLANDDEGKHRVKVAAERKDVWVSKQIEKGDENAVDKSVPVDLQEMERANLENADASVRAAVLGKFERGEIAKRSAAVEFETHTPIKTDETQVDDNTLQDAEPGGMDIRLPTPERAPPQKRNIENGDIDMDDNEQDRSVARRIVTTNSWMESPRATSSESSTRPFGAPTSPKCTLPSVWRP